MKRESLFDERLLVANVSHKEVFFQNKDLLIYGDCFEKFLSERNVNENELNKRSILNFSGSRGNKFKL